MRRIIAGALGGLMILALACTKDDGSIDINTPAENPPNILLIIADDLGKDAISGYSEGSIKPTTPHIDAIRNSGLSFTNFWVYSTCTPTRSSIITGKYGYSTGVKEVGDILGNSENILHNYIKSETNNSYSTALVGKWHLAGNVNSTFNPELLGMDYYAGLLSGGGGYTEWNFTEDGVTTTENSYITEKFADLSIDWINAQEKPWFLWLAYTSPHTPFHAPPVGMHSQGNLPAYSDGMDPMPYYMASIEAMDFQIGRLLENMSSEERENTLIIFIGDNGTPRQVAQSPYSRNTVKGTLYQGGINTPMFISGKGVNRVGTEDNLINGTDLFATIAAISGVSVDQIHDSHNFSSLFTDHSQLRDFQYSEMYDGTNDAWTISNGRYKLIESANNGQELYDLINDPYEQSNLLNGVLTTDATNAKAQLESELSNIRR